ncbi:hypothetical protein [Leifsonia shinshuensis]|uniref:Zf-HC2 domain-containing protein n=1 Tax=Leifsonia shinshuensis TaxID=150026 RepID=A0A853D209_9MICO|nr:hypothetical protein [Leifsonia shinshuensis]NYJ25444.1 hypothetical protein [Leifsonia shinshuensis]
MSARSRIGEFLDTDRRDAGCAETMSLMHVFAELVLAGRDAAARYPGVALHLSRCAACGDDYAGLLAALRG